MGQQDQASRLHDAISWDGLVRMAPLLVSTLDHEHLLRWLLVMAVRAVGAEACTLALNELETGELKYAVVLGEKEDAVRRFPVRSGEGILGWVAREGKPILAPDVARHPLWRREIADKIGFRTRSIVCVPLLMKGEVVGALEVINKRDGTVFSDDDLDILTGFAGIASVYIENARLYEWLRTRPDVVESGMLARLAELRRRKAERDAIIRHMSDGVIILDAAGHVAEVNEAAERFLGVDGPDVVGLHISDERLAAGPLREVVRTLLSSEDTRGREWLIPTAGGGTVACRPSSFHDDLGARAGMLLTLSDVTTLADISRLKTEFVAYVSHELKAPLTCMRGFADILLSTDPEQVSGEERREFLSIIRTESDRSIRLINRLLNVARIEAGKGVELIRTPVNPVALARRVAGMADALSEKHTIRLEVEEGVPMLDADGDQIEEVLLNLLNNAVKYSPDGGQIVVRVASADEGVRISVSDPGIGMKPEQIAGLFGRYQRVLSDAPIAGTGLGLYVSKGIVDAHGGRIQVESAPGQGSTFTVTLPIRSSRGATSPG